MIRVLGFCASPRVGNSQYLMEEALEAAKKRAEELGETIEIDTCTIRGKKLAGCVMCQGCMKDGTCLIKDDFAGLQEKWDAADIVIYSIPVYHMGVPAQLKAFWDRLGNSSFGRMKKIFGEHIVTTPRPMKVIGCISQGIHSSSGQENTILQCINHALISGCIPVNGDLWESYVGAGGWTLNDEHRDALKNQYEAGEESARVAVVSSRTLAVRAMDVAVLLKKGAQNCPAILEDPKYIAFAEQIKK
ncbi:MAG: flavodoxin family protein [Clostridia bacterium]|nr:flavodoxin family protein [Clostridia bacterium]